MRTMLISLILMILVTLCNCENETSSEIVDHVNSRKSKWEARHTHFSQMKKERIRRIMGTRPRTKENMLPNKKTVLAQVSVAMAPSQEKVPSQAMVSPTSTLPSSFDAREKWPNCTTIGKIRNQGICGSCWAFATASAMSDRLCIMTKGSQDVVLSAQHLLSCCTDCGDGCDGGMTSESWNYWILNGVVTGGDYKSNTGCLTYTSEPYFMGITPECRTECRNGSNKIFQKDLRKGFTAYSLSNSPEEIQRDIYTYGPITGIMKVYSDFLMYSNGTYEHLIGGFIGYHAIKIFGWGEENNTPYWRVANSWGTNWGEKGFCKIAHHSDAEVEEMVNAGIPRI